MNFPFIKTHPFAVLAALLCFAVQPALGQKFKVDADEPEFEDFLSPEFDTSTVKKFKPKEWLEMEAKINIRMSPAPPTDTLDRVMVKWYVAVENPERSGTYYLLTKDVQYVNVPLAEDVYSAIYLSPASVKRLLGTDRNGKKAIFSVGYEVIVNGVVQGAASTKLDPGWWNKASPKIARTDLVPLLSKNETPFRNLWWDRYAEEQVDRR